MKKGKAKETKTIDVDKQEKKSIRIRRVKTGFLFSGILIPLVCVVAIPLSLNKNYSLKRTKYFTDDRTLYSIDKNTIKENNKTYKVITLTSKSLNVSDIMSESARYMNIPQKSFNNSVTYSNKINIRTNTNLLKNTKINETKVTKITNSNQTIFKLDLVQLWNEINSKSNNKISEFDFLSNIESINNAMTYSYIKNNKLFYFDNKQGYSGYIIQKFFENFDVEIRKENLENKNVNVLEAFISSTIELNESLTEIKKITFDTKITLKYEI